MGGKCGRQRKYLHLFLAVALIILIFGGCAGTRDQEKSRSRFLEPREHLRQGEYSQSLKLYQEVLRTYPELGDQALFKTGLIYAYPKNPARDYQKSIEYLQRVTREYTYSDFKEEAETIIHLINEVSNEDKKARNLQRQVEALERQIDALERQIAQMKEIDFNLEEKKRKRVP